MNLYLKISKLWIISHLITKIFNMKKLLKIVFLLLSISFAGLTYAGAYDDWPDDAICTWLEQKPEHEGYLAENEKRGLNCFDDPNFSHRNFVPEHAELRMY